MNMGERNMILKTIGAVAIFVVVIFVIRLLIIKPLTKKIDSLTYTKAIAGISTILIQVLLYWKLRELVFLNVEAISIKLFIIGFLLATIVISFPLIILKLKSKFIVVKENQKILPIIINLLVFFFITALFEEFIFRGLLYYGLRSVFPFYLSLLIGVIIFTIPHLFNKGINFFSVTSVILGGIILSTLYEITGTVLAPLGFHFGWNIIQGFFGFDVSGGQEIKGIYKSKLIGNKLLTGGKFGIEASIYTLIPLFILAISLIIYKVI